MDKQLTTLFPELFNDNARIEIILQMVKKARAQIDFTLDPTPDKGKIYQSTLDHYLEMTKPLDFDEESAKSNINEHHKSLETLCIALEQNGVHNPKQLTGYEFYNRIAYYKKAQQGNDSRNYTGRGFEMGRTGRDSWEQRVDR